MNKSYSHSVCQSAELYYYDYLHGGKDQIPEELSSHIAHCSDCQSEIKWLTQLVVNPKEDVQQNQAAAHARQIQLHCDLIDQAVTCSDVKSFLPILAIPEMDIRISTPVTAHIQACLECARDLETLKQLNLSPEQLSGLSQIFSQKQTEDSIGVEAVTDAFFQDKKASSIEIRKIMDRPDSGVVTTFSAENGFELTENQSQHVEIANQDSKYEKAPLADLQQTARTKRLTTATKHWLRPVAAAAAIIVVAILLFQSPSLKATDIGEIYGALKNVQNITMTQYDADIDIPVQTTYISRSLGIKVFETNGDFTLYDIKNKTRKTKADSALEIQQTDIDHQMVQVIAGSMDVPWGLLPFKKDSDLPDGAVWKKVYSEQDELSANQTEIFDLLWSAEVTGKRVDYQWRCYLDAATKRPFKVEWRSKSQGNSDYELTAFTEISYPTENQVKEAIQQTGL